MVYRIWLLATKKKTPLELRFPYMKEVKNILNGEWVHPPRFITLQIQLKGMYKNREIICGVVAGKNPHTPYLKMCLSKAPQQKGFMIDYPHPRKNIVLKKNWLHWELPHTEDLRKNLFLGHSEQFFEKELFIRKLEELTIVADEIEREIE